MRCDFMCVCGSIKMKSQQERERERELRAAIQSFPLLLLQKEKRKNAVACAFLRWHVAQSVAAVDSSHRNANEVQGAGREEKWLDRRKFHHAIHQRTMERRFKRRI